jgi:hypothetical protein
VHSVAAADKHCCPSMAVWRDQRSKQVVQTDMAPVTSRRASQFSVVVLHCRYENTTGYALDPHPNFGATVGRVANRCVRVRPVPGRLSLE